MQNTIVTDVKKQAKWRDELIQQAKSEFDIDFLENNQDQHMVKIYRLIYDTDEKYKANSRHHVEYNLTEQLINELCITFREGYDIKINPGQERTELIQKKEDQLQDILSSAMLLPTLKQVDKLAELNKFCAILVQWDQEEKAVRLDIIPRYLCFVEQSETNPKKIDAFYYQIGVMENTHNRSDVVNRYQKITKDYYVKIEKNQSTGTEIEIPGTEEPNPYGMIPIAEFIPEVRVDTYFPTKRTPIVDFNIIINKMMTNYQVTFDIQSFSSLVIKGRIDRSDLKVGQNAFINLVNDPKLGGSDTIDANYINPGIDLEKLHQTIKKHCEDFANAVGVSASLYNNTQSDFSSGYQLMLSKSDIIKKANDKADFYQQSLNKLVNIIAKVYSYSSTDTFDNFEIKAKIKPLKVEMSEAEKIDTYLKKTTLGITSAVEIIMQEEKISREDAEQRVAEINADNNIGQGSTPPVDILGN